MNNQFINHLLCTQHTYSLSPAANCSLQTLTGLCRAGLLLQLCMKTNMFNLTLLQHRVGRLWSSKNIETIKLHLLHMAGTPTQCTRPTLTFSIRTKLGKVYGNSCSFANELSFLHNLAPLILSPVNHNGHLTSIKSGLSVDTVRPLCLFILYVLSYVFVT